MHMRRARTSSARDSCICPLAAVSSMAMRMLHAGNLNVNVGVTHYVL